MNDDYFSVFTHVYEEEERRSDRFTHMQPSKPPVTDNRPDNRPGCCFFYIVLSHRADAFSNLIGQESMIKFLHAATITQPDTEIKRQVSIIRYRFHSNDSHGNAGSV